MCLRAGILVILFFSLIAPLAEAAPNPVPVVTIHLEPSQQAVNATAAQVSAIFNGTVSVDKMPIETVKVDLVSSVENGLPSSVTPNSMTFDNTDPQSFTCTVTVPMGTYEQYTTITIDATGRTYLFTVIASCKNTLVIEGPPPPSHKSNSTTTNSTTGQNKNTNGNQTSSNSGGGSGELFGLKNEQLVYPLSAIIVILVVLATVAYRWRAKKRSVVDY